jgi:hypothetical protein
VIPPSPDLEIDPDLERFGMVRGESAPAKTCKSRPLQGNFLHARPRS